MLHLGVYSEIIPLLKKGYGIYYDTDYYVTKKPEYRKDYIKLERFSFDIISLVGENLLKITHDEFEMLLRETFHSITFSQNGKLKFLDLDSIDGISEYLQPNKVSSLTQVYSWYSLKYPNQLYFTDP